MAISHNPRNQFESSESSYRAIDSKTEIQTIAPKNPARRGGLIINKSAHDLVIWLGSKPPKELSDWILIPSRSNCDIPLGFVGQISGAFRGDDNKIAQLFEFY